VDAELKPRHEATRRAAAAEPKAAAKAARQAAECDRMADALRDIRSRMRSGYGAKEGEQLEGAPGEASGTAARRALRQLTQQQAAADGPAGA
jgi:hypothetical protein